MNVLIGGASGLLGRSLAAQLEGDGHNVRRLVRGGRTPSRGEHPWGPDCGVLDPGHLEDVDAVVHLSGESIGDGRWTRDRKRRIRASRVDSTRLLAETIAGRATRPEVFLCASAIGYYGDSGPEWVDETAPCGGGFLAPLCEEWEAATAPARDAGARVVNMRFGVVLSRQGGALSKMLLPFRLGLGGPIGSGRQHMNWVSRDDAVGAARFLLDAHDLAGPVNVVSPNPVTNREFSQALGRVLRRPAVLPVPAPVVRMALGDMADELLLYNQRVSARKLMDAGYRHVHAGVEDALRAAIAERTGR